MGVWNATERRFLQRLALGIRSSVGTLALPLRPLYSNISLFLSSFSWGIPIWIVQGCQSYSQFHNCNYLSQIWQRAFARFLILPGELHLGGPKPNCHNPGLGAPILYKLPLLPPQESKGSVSLSFISWNYVVWPTFLLMNVFIALKGSHFWFLFDFTAAGVVPCGGRKTSPRTSTIVQFIFYFSPLRSAIIFWEIRNKWLV